MTKREVGDPREHYAPMPKQGQHTPTPWQVRVTSGRYGPKNGMGQIHNGDASNPIGNVPLPDAAFIVRACNSHDALVAALRDVLDDGGNDLSPHSERVIRAALAQVDTNKE